MNLPPLTAAQYREEIVADKQNCVLVFSKETCKVCAKLEPTIVKLADEYQKSDNLDFYTMNVLDDECNEIFKSMDLVGVPQTVFIKEGAVKEALPGSLSEDILRSELEDMLRPKKGWGARLKGFFS